MRMRVLLGLVAVALVGADAPDEATRKELAKFRGTWELVSGQMDGKPIKDEHVKGSTATWEGDRVTLRTPHQSAEEIRARIVRVSPSKDLKEMEWIRESGPHRGKAVVAIYEFQDADHYKICFHPAGETKPDRFGTEAGSGHIFHVWRRVKK